MTPRRTRCASPCRTRWTAALFGEGDYTLEVLRGKTSRVKLREHDAEALEGQRQADTQGEVAEPENTSA